MHIDSIADWHFFALLLRNRGFLLYFTQDDVTGPNGFRAWFFSAGFSDVVFVTCTPAVQAAIIRFNPQTCWPHFS